MSEAIATALGLHEQDLRVLVGDIWSSLFTPPPEDLDVAEPFAEAITGFVDISGDWDGRVKVSTTQGGAIAIAAEMLHLPASDVAPADLDDAMGELANIVGGSVKSCVVGHAELSLPKVAHSAVADSIDPDHLDVAAIWNDHPLRVSVRSGRPEPRIPSRRKP